MLRALDLGLPAAGGLEMLVAQAKTAAELFLGRPLPDEEIDRVHRGLQAERSNCVLIAMPGAGKTTVGSRAARMLGKTFVDTDDEITAHTGRTPAQIIEQEGEAAFREIESRVIAEIAKKGGQLIATGGGAVTRAGKYAAAAAERGHPLHRPGALAAGHRRGGRSPATLRPCASGISSGIRSTTATAT